MSVRNLVRVRPALSLVRRSLVGLLLQPAVIGALYLLALTAWASRAPFVEANDHALGPQARGVGEMVAAHFADDIRKMAIAIACAAAAIGASLGLFSAGLVMLRDRVMRRSSRAGKQRARATFIVLIAVHAWLFAWGMACAPQAYVESFYARGGVRRALQVTVTDLIGARACFWLGVAAMVLYVAGPPSGWRALPGRVARRLRAVTVLLPLRAVASIAAPLATLALSVLVVSRLPSASAAPASKPNVIILAADSLRADRLDPRTTPHLCALADRGTRFDRAYVSLPRTFPSWVTILTGRHAHHHGVRSMFARWEDRARDMDALPARLRKEGYRTAVISDYAGDIFGRVDLGFDDVLTPTFNFHQLIRSRAIERQTPMMPLLDSRLGRAAFPVIREWNEAARADLLADEAADEIDRLRSSPFMLTVFFSTAHFPYAAPAPYYSRFTDPNYRGRFKYHKPVGLGGDDDPDAADVAQVRALYDGAVLSIDDAAQRLIDHLERRGLLENTIIIVTADHGETLFDNGHGQGHGDHLFGDEGTHVPLVIVDPRKNKPRREGSIVRDVDLAATIYELLGVSPPSDLDGRSLAPALEGRSLAPALAYAETELWMGDVPALPDALRLPYPPLSRLTEIDVAHDHEIVLRNEVTAVTTVARHRMVRDERYKLLYMPARSGPVYRLFDTTSDPAELVDVSSIHLDVVSRLKAELWRWMLMDPKMMERGGFLVPRELGETVDGPLPETIRIDSESPKGDLP